jgi:hypothetical protein
VVAVGALDYAIRRTGVGVRMPAGQAAARADGHGPRQLRVVGWSWAWSIRTFK